MPEMRPAASPVTTCPAIGLDGTVYFGCDDGKLYALNPDGNKKWDFTAGGAVGSSPAIAADGTVYFDGRARLKPVLENQAVVNAASLDPATGVSPGSLAVFRGRGLSDLDLTAAGPGFPISLGGVSVSIDASDQGVQAPARIAMVAAVACHRSPVAIRTASMSGRTARNSRMSR